MRPCGVTFYQLGVKDEPAMVINGGNEPPFTPGFRGEEMPRGVMLDQFSDIVGNDFSVMWLDGFFPWDVETVCFGSIDNCC